MAPAETTFILDLDPSHITLLPDLGSVVLLDVQNPCSILFLQAGSLPKGRCLSAGVPGFKFVTEQPKLAACPFVVRVNGDEDFVALAFKANGANLYLYGLSVSKLKEWLPPAKGDESEESLLRAMNTNKPGLIGAFEISNTETFPLKDKVEELLKYLPSFNRQARPKVTTLDGMNQWVDREFSKNSSECVKFAEIRDRSRAKSRGAAAGGQAGAALSSAGGADAFSKWAELLKMLKQSATFYDHPFDERFILIKSIADVGNVRAFLKSAAAAP